MFLKFLSALSLIAILSGMRLATAATFDREPAPSQHEKSLNAHELEDIKALYKRLIDAENRHGDRHCTADSSGSSLLSIKQTGRKDLTHASHPQTT
jgi:hypothetical protein